MIASEVSFKKVQSQDVKVGDVEQLIVEESGKYVYYYYRAKAVLIGKFSDSIYDCDGKFVGERIVDCVEINWLPINEVGKAFTRRYQKSATLDIASNVTNASKLIQEEEATE